MGVDSAKSVLEIRHRIKIRLKPLGIELGFLMLCRTRCLSKRVIVQARGQLIPLEYRGLYA